MESLRLLDFELHIDTARPDGLFPLEVLRSPGGEAEGLFDLESLSARVRRPGPPATLQEARTIGGELYRALLRDDAVRGRFRLSRELAAAQQAGLRLRLRVEPPELAALPWELLYDEQADEFIGLSRTTSIVRYLTSPTPAGSLVVEPPLRILAFAASPSDLAPVDRDAERARLTEAVARLQRRHAVDLVWVEGQTAYDLQTALQDGPFHILHYVGHAQLSPETGQGELLLVGEDGASAPLDTHGLVSLLGGHSLRLVVLNACQGAATSLSASFSSLASALVESGLPAVIAMQYEITMQAAASFTRTFYGALASALPVDAAMAEARTAMRQAAPTSSEWATPILYLRAADGALWEMKPLRRSIWTYAAAALVSSLLLLGVWALIYWVLLPWLFPTQMTGDSRIAVAQIGVLDEDGRMRQSEFGESISRTIYRELDGTFKRAVEADQLGGQSVLVWHDDVGRPEKNVRFGWIQGATASERAANAEKLARRVDATFVVYGFLTPTSTGEALTLEFYSVDAEQAGEPQATIGGQNFGAPIISGVRFVDSENGAWQDVRPQLDRRLTALYWITRGLLLNLANRPEEAYQVLAEGRRVLEGAAGRGGWQLRDGKDLYLVFEGQAALYSGHYEEGLAALEAVLAERPDYVNALVLKGGVLLDRAQRFFLRGLQLTEQQRFCMGTANPLDPIPTTEELVATAAQTIDDARRDAAEAVEVLERAVAHAPEWTWPPIESQARMDLGLAYRVRGTIALVENRLADAEADFLASAVEFTSALSLLDPETQPQYVGWTQAGLGATQRIHAALRTRQVTEAEIANDPAGAAARKEEGIQFLRDAIQSYNACIDQREATRGNLVFTRRVLECTCVPQAQEAMTALVSIEGTVAPPITEEGAPDNAAQGDRP